MSVYFTQKIRHELDITTMAISWVKVQVKEVYFVGKKKKMSIYFMSKMRPKIDVKILMGYLWIKISVKQTSKLNIKDVSLVDKKIYEIDISKRCLIYR